MFSQLSRTILLLMVTVLLAACGANGGTATSVTATPLPGVPTLRPTEADPGWLMPRSTPNLAKLPLLAAHFERVEAALKQPVPILLLENLDEAQTQAQTIAVNDSRFQAYTHDPDTGEAFRNEIFGVYPLRESDITPQTPSCATTPCYRVEMYNYALNFYLAAVVDLEAEAVINVVGYQDTQPDIPPGLTDIALEIATNSIEVQHTLGIAPEASDALMENTKTALNTTVCERSRHLCVAPTFVVGERALWAIVDLTDGTIVGLRWTQVGSATPITEKALANEAIMRRYCQQNTALERDGWSLSYMLTGSDGLRISEVTFQEKPVFDSVKLVDWHVSYSQADGFGYSDAVGCPVFSQAAVIAVEPPVVEDLIADGEVVGFVLEQEFWSDLWPAPCNYYYEQRYEFYADGRFRPVAANIGRGCGDNGTYRPVTRIAPAGDGYTFSEWDGAAWLEWQTEAWRHAADVPVNPDGNSFRFTSASGGYEIAPATGQFGDGGQGDNAYVYVTLDHNDRDEGASDMPTIGPCCNTDYQQGPEKFIDPTPEPIANSKPVIWYVAQLDNDGTPGSEYCWADSVLENGVYVPVEYPCPSGPMLIPVKPGEAS
jgi:hypothetical protein